MRRRGSLLCNEYNNRWDIRSHVNLDSWVWSTLLDDDLIFLIGLSNHQEDYKQDFTCMWWRNLEGDSLRAPLWG